jgi:hypothetical protein
VGGDLPDEEQVQAASTTLIGEAGRGGRVRPGRRAGQALAEVRMKRARALALRRERALEALVALVPDEPPEVLVEQER